LETESEANLLIFRLCRIGSEEIKLETEGTFEGQVGRGKVIKMETGGTLSIFLPLFMHNVAAILALFASFWSF
jgi:hypothetical protein